MSSVPFCDFDKTTASYYFKSALLLFILSEGITVKTAFESHINEARRQMLSRLCTAARYAFPDESTGALDEFVALALLCIKEGNELINLLYALRGNQEKQHYVGSKLLPALVKERPEMFTPAVLRELCSMLGGKSDFCTDMQDALMNAQDAFVCASGPGA